MKEGFRDKEVEIVLENNKIRCVILPSDGGRVVSIFDKKLNREFIWNNIRTQNMKRYYGCNYDNMGAGGIEEAFPTGFGDNFEGDEIPFFGEFWSAVWDINMLSAEMVTLCCYSAIYPIKIEKTYRITSGAMHCNYKLTNIGSANVPCLFGIHPSLNIMAGDILELPQETYKVGFAKNPDNNAIAGETFEWPNYKGRDMRKLNSDIALNQCFEFRKVGLSEGFIRVISRDHSSLTIDFDPEFFTSMSIWQIYGGWRGHHCIMAEFFTGAPYKLSDAVAAGNYLNCKAGKTYETRVSYIVN